MEVLVDRGACGDWGWDWNFNMELTLDIMVTYGARKEVKKKRFSSETVNKGLARS